MKDTKLSQVLKYHESVKMSYPDKNLSSDWDGTIDLLTVTFMVVARDEFYCAHSLLLCLLHDRLVPCNMFNTMKDENSVIILSWL